MKPKTNKLQVVVISILLSITLLANGCVNNRKRDWDKDFDREFEQFGKEAKVGRNSLSRKSGYYNLEELLWVIGSIFLVSKAIDNQDQRCTKDC